VIALGAALWSLRRRAGPPWRPSCSSSGSLFPALGFVNLYGARYSWVWDHWQYLPDLGLIALAAAGLAACLRVVGPHARLGRRLRRRSPRSSAALTWEHCAMFHDDQTLYRETIARNPDAGWRTTTWGSSSTRLPRAGGRRSPSTRGR
jgi:protein O-mannosyl-transferase